MVAFDVKKTTKIPPPEPTPPSARKRGEVVALPEEPKALPPALIRGIDDPGTTPEALIQKRLHVGLPTHGEMKPDAAKQWADDMAFKLLPDAMAEVAWNLRHGDKKDRAAAVEQVLDMNNMRKRDIGSGNTPTIILNLGNGDGASLPWLKRDEGK